MTLKYEDKEASTEREDNRRVQAVTCDILQETAHCSTWASAVVQLCTEQTGVSCMVSLNSLTSACIISALCWGILLKLCTKKKQTLGCLGTDWFHHSDSPKGSIVCTPHPRTAQWDARYAQLIGEVKPQRYDWNCKLHFVSSVRDLETIGAERQLNIPFSSEQTIFVFLWH